MEFTWFTNELLLKLGEHRSQKVVNDLNDILSSINSMHHVKKIVEIRRRFVSRGTTKIFTNWRISEGHAYTYNGGARSELQANIGIFTDGIRIGYGFEPTSAMFGLPDRIHRFLNIARELLQSANSVTYDIWKKLSPLYAERALKTNDLQRNNKLQFNELYNWLNTENATWIFWGYFIGIEQDGKTPSILDHENSLDFIDTFFATTLDFYEEVWKHYNEMTSEPHI